MTILKNGVFFTVLENIVILDSDRKLDRIEAMIAFFNIERVIGLLAVPSSEAERRLIVVEAVSGGAKPLPAHVSDNAHRSNCSAGHAALWKDPGAHRRAKR